jgi:hypothetical protein
MQIIEEEEAKNKKQKQPCLIICLKITFSFFSSSLLSLSFVCVLGSGKK